MSEILLRTKLFVPPLRPLLVPRPRLLQRLNSGLRGKCTLVSAPAGFGKTTLITHWLKQQDQPAAWLSLDDNDDNPRRFFAYLIAAVQTIQPHLAESLAAALHSPNPPLPTAVIPALLNELAAHPDSFILVLDDYHEIHDPDIHAAVAALIDYMPPSLHLVITSRDIPPLPLPRWRVRGQLTDIRAADLRFTTAEATQFMQETMALTLPETAVADLEARTEGWIAGLQLAALSLRHSDDREQLVAEFVGSQRQVADYLLQEVLLRQPEPVQQFLLQTAVLDRFNAALCDALLGESNSQSILEQLEQNNLFLIPLDHSRYWYRYHHLFAQLLRYRLQREWSATAVVDLHRRAIAWYEANDLLQEAVQQAFQIPDEDEVARLLSTIPLYYVLVSGGSLQILQWGGRLSDQLLTRHPDLLLLYTGAALVNGQTELLYKYLPLFPDDDPVLSAWQKLFRSIITRNESGDHQTALTLAQEALALGADGTLLRSMSWGQIAVNQYSLGQLEEADEAVMAMRQTIPDIGDATVTLQLQAIELQILNARAQGNLQQAERLCQEGIALAEADGAVQSPWIGVMYTGLANVYYAWNEMDRVVDYVEKALDWARRTGISDLFTYSGLIQANLACWRGDGVALKVALENFVDRYNDSRLAQVTATLERLTAWFWLRMGDVATAVAWANASGLTLQDEPAFHEFDTYYTLVAVRLAESRPADDNAILTQLLTMIGRLEGLVVTSRHVGGLVEALTLKALIQDSQKDTIAMETIGRALDLARPGNFMRAFLDWGEPMQQLLTKAVAAEPDFVGRLLTAFAAEPTLAGETAVVPANAAPQSDPTIQLTPRETEILHLIAAGLSNKAIQEKLFISKNTVRTHIKNLYSKLDVKSRTQAIKQARDLNLI